MNKYTDVRSSVQLISFSSFFFLFAPSFSARFKCLRNPLTIDLFASRVSPSSKKLPRPRFASVAPFSCYLSHMMNTRGHIFAPGTFFLECCREVKKQRPSNVYVHIRPFRNTFHKYHYSFGILADGTVT